MNFCSHCGSQLRQDQKFCDKCGTAIEPQASPVTETVPKTPLLIHCPACNHEIGKKVKKCPHCGTALQPSQLGKFFRSMYLHAFLIIVLPLLAANSLEPDYWQIGVYFRHFAFVAPIVFLLIKNRRNPFTRKFNLVLASYGFLLFMSILSHAERIKKEEEFPMRLQAMVDEYWESKTFDHEGYRYALCEEGLSHSLGGMSSLIRFESTDKVESYSMDRSTGEVRIKFPNCEYINVDASRYPTVQMKWVPNAYRHNCKAKIIGDKLIILDEAGLRTYGKGLASN